MMIDEHLDQKYVAIWVANYESHDKKIQESIQRIIDVNHKKKIKTVIFRSGSENFQEQTANLLEYAAKKYRPNQTIDRESIDLFTTLCYNYLTDK